MITYDQVKEKPKQFLAATGLEDAMHRVQHDESRAVDQLLLEFLAEV